MPSRRDRAQAALRRDIRLARLTTPLVQQTFRTELKAVLAAVEAGDEPESGVSLELWDQTVGQIWVRVGEAVYDPHFIMLTGKLPTAGKAAPRRELSALIQQIISDGRPITHVRSMITEQAQGISVQTRRLIRTRLRDANLQELRQVTKALKSLYLTDFVKDRSYRLALNEALRASIVFENEAALSAQARLVNFKYTKVWVTVGDEAVRPAHRDADGQQVDMDQPFNVDGENLMYPRDVGSPGNTYNCRCWVEHERVRVAQDEATRI